jgi:hypothetical protein
VKRIVEIPDLHEGTFSHSGAEDQCLEHLVLLRCLVIAGTLVFQPVHVRSDCETACSQVNA